GSTRALIRPTPPSRRPALSLHERSSDLTRVYRLGDWPSIFAIVLVLDRLSALMLVLTAILGAAALVFSIARWDRAGANFLPLFQFQLMGLNGAFLTDRKSVG